MQAETVETIARSVLPPLDADVVVRQARAVVRFVRACVCVRA
jgi:hypothetical protein